MVGEYGGREWWIGFVDEYVGQIGWKAILGRSGRIQYVGIVDGCNEWDIYMLMYKTYKYAVTIIYSDFYYKHIVKRKFLEINNNQNFESTS